MAAQMNQLKHINDAIKYCVFGYVRSFESLLTLIDGNKQIPVLISYLCLIYYYHGEFFLKCGDDIKISENKQMIIKESSICGYNNTSYGSTWIKSNDNLICKWSLFINDINDKKTTSVGNIWIAIVSKDDKINNDCSTDNDRPNYSFSNNIHVFLCGKGSTVNMVKFNKNDHIEIILNTKLKTISFKRINFDNDYVVIFKDIEKHEKIKYKLAIQLYSKNDSVTINDFKCKQI